MTSEVEGEATSGIQAAAEWDFHNHNFGHSCLSATKYPFLIYSFYSIPQFSQLQNEVNFSSALQRYCEDSYDTTDMLMNYLLNKMLRYNINNI